MFQFGLGDNAFSPEGYKTDAEMTRLFRQALANDKRFRVSLFSRSHPAVKRALAEGSISAGVLWPPFTGKSRGRYTALSLSALMRADLAVAGVVESIQFDGEKKQSRLVASILIFDVKSRKLLGNVVLSAVGSGETEAAAATAAVAKYIEIVVPQVIAVLTARPKEKEPPAGGRYR
ncbi:MAG: hypothetical protein IH851_01145 [Armatimonadetes bacterium]|nr:hypothetical protein [Armatimonadota bacterium]